MSSSECSRLLGVCGARAGLVSALGGLSYGVMSKYMHVSKMLSAIISKSDNDYIDICHTGKDQFLIQFDRKTKSGTFWSRLFAMQEPHFQASGDAAAQKLVKDYLAMSRLEFENEYS